MTWATVEDVLNADRESGTTMLLNGVATGNLTSASVNSGGLSVAFLPNNIGSTLWSAIKGFQFPDGIDSSSDWRALWAKNASTRVGAYWIALAHKIGDVNLSATGQQLTHASTGFPLSRTMAEGPVAVRGFPAMLITTATSTTAPVIGNIKYVNQDGITVTCAQSFTFPATNTLAGSSYLLSIEDADSSVQDILEVNVTTAAAAGAASLYLIEPVLPASVFVAGMVSQSDGLRGARFGLPRINPPAPASGVLDTIPVLMCAGVVSTNTGTAQLRIVKQT